MPYAAGRDNIDVKALLFRRQYFVDEIARPDIDIAGEQRRDIELDRNFRKLGFIDARLGDHGAINEFFIAADLQADFFADEIGRRLDAGLGERKQHERIAAIDHRERNHWNALAARHQNLVGPGDTELLVAARDHLDGRKIGTARLNVHVETRGFVDALVLGHIEPGELRLIEPFQSHGDRVSGMRGPAQAAQHQRHDGR